MKELSLFILLLFLFILLVLSPGRINSFRHYFAGVIFLFSIQRYLSGGGIRYLILLLVTPFIHFAFIMIAPLLLFYQMIGTRYWIYYFLILGSFFFSRDVADYAQDYVAGLDENALQYHASQYTSEVYLKKVAELKVQRYFILDKYIYFTTLFFLVFTFFSVHYFKIQDLHLKNFFAMSLLIFAFVNLFSDLESVANRFGVIYHGFCCLFLLRLYQTVLIKPPLFLRSFFYIFFILNAVIVLRILIQSASVSLVLLFYPVSFWFPIEVSILEWIK